MNMRFNKLKMLGVVMAVMAFTPLAAQDLKMNGFAGEDKELIFVPTPDNPTTDVQLGSNDPATTSANCVFSWRVVEGPASSYNLINAHSNMPILRVSLGGEYIVEATRVSQYGYQTETVCISVMSEVVLVSATSKKDCWVIGDEVSPSDFEFVTSPADYNYLIRVKESDRVIGGFGLENWYGDEEIHFEVRDLDGDNYTDCDVTAEIFVSIGDFLDIGGLEGLKDIGKLKENVAKLQQLKEVVKNANNKVDRFLGVMDLVEKFTPPAAPLTKKVDKKFEVDFGLIMECCEIDDEKFPTVSLKMGGAFKFFAGVEVRAPLFPPIPKFGVDFYGSLGAGVSASGAWKITTPEYSECYDISIEFAATGVIEVGAQASLFDPDICNVTPVLYGEVGGKSKIKILPRPDFEFDELYITCGLRATGTFLGFNKELFNLPFGKFPLMK